MKKPYKSKLDIQSMKVIDELFGPLVCFIFYFYNFFKKLFSKYILQPHKVKNILLIKFFGMGSILLAGPMMRALKQKFPKAKITVLTFQSNTPVCERITLIDEVMSVETENWLKLISSMLKSILKIRKKHYEISIDMEFFSKFSTVVQYLCATPVRVGYYLIQIGIFIKMMWRGNLHTHPVFYNPHKHITEAFLAFARTLDADTDDLRLAEVKIFDSDKKKIEQIFEKTNIAATDFLVAVNINTGLLCLERRWPMKNFAWLINKLQEYEKIKIILIGDKNDIDYVKSFLATLNSQRNIVDLTGKLDFGTLAALMSKVNLLISNDSGPVHLAASLDKSVVAFFGPEIPERFGPVGEKHTVFYPDIYCSPCLTVYNQKTAPCNGNNRCMYLILPEEVYKAVKEKYLKDL